MFNEASNKQLSTLLRELISIFEDGGSAKDSAKVGKQKAEQMETEV